MQPLAHSAAVADRRSKVWAAARNIPIAARRFDFTRPVRTDQHVQGPELQIGLVGTERQKIPQRDASNEHAGPLIVWLRQRMPQSWRRIIFDRRRAINDQRHAMSGGFGDHTTGYRGMVATKTRYCR